MPDSLHPMHSLSWAHPPNSPPVKVLKPDYHFMPGVIGGSPLPVMGYPLLAGHK